MKELVPWVMWWTRLPSDYEFNGVPAALAVLHQDRHRILPTRQGAGQWLSRFFCHHTPFHTTSATYFTQAFSWPLWRRKFISIKGSFFGVGMWWWWGGVLLRTKLLNKIAGYLFTISFRLQNDHNQNVGPTTSWALLIWLPELVICSVCELEHFLLAILTVSHNWKRSNK